MSDRDISSAWTAVLTARDAYGEVTGGRKPMFQTEMQLQLNSPAPPERLIEYIKENSSTDFEYRQRAVLVKHQDRSWHLVCCVVQALSRNVGCPERKASRRYDRALLFEEWQNAESCNRFVKDVQSGKLCFDDIVIERKTNASWRSEFLSSLNMVMDEAGLLVGTKFEQAQIDFGADLLTGRNLPFYATLEEAAREWLPLKQYHAQSDARNQEVLFLLPEFRAQIARAVVSKGSLKIEVKGRDADDGRPLHVKGSYRAGNQVRHFEKRVVKKKATVSAERGASAFRFILTNDEDRIFDFRDVPDELPNDMLRPPPHDPLGDGTGRDVFETPNYELIPAADRVVWLDHNSKPYRDAIEKLDQLIETIRAANDFTDAEEKDEVAAEISAGRLLLKPARVRSQLIWEVLERPLLWLIEKFAGGFVGEIGKRALDAVRNLLGL